MQLEFFGYVKLKNSKEEEKQDKQIDQRIEEDYENMKKNSVMYQEEATIDKLKEEYKMTGKNDLYTIEIEGDGRRVLTIKPTINYKVAFCGMIKQQMPNFKELDEIYAKNSPTKNGIWIYEKDREKIVNYLNQKDDLKAQYGLTEDGYLTISDTKDLLQKDHKIKQLIESDKQYVVSIASKCYMVDPVTGEIIENRYNDLEEYQTYEYLEDDQKTILFISENIEKKLSEDEIFESLMDLIQ